MSSRLRNFTKYLVFCLSLVFIFNYSFSASLQLQRIGSLDLGGNTYPEWWYTGTKPVLYGTAENNSTVSIKIGESTSSATADASGNWTYATQVDEGDHNIEISQGEEKISFILHAGQTFTGSVSGETETKESTTTVPDTGFNQYIAMSFGVGIILLATYFYFSTDSKRKTVFETRMLKED